MKSSYKIYVSLIFLISLVLSGTDNVNAQIDPEAQKVMEQFVKKNKSFEAIKIEFSLITENLQNNEKSTVKGNAILKGDKYKLNFNKNIIYCDSKNIFSYLPDEKEVSVSKCDPKKEENMLTNPTYMFKIYAKNYKYRLLGDTKYNNKDCYEIDFYPNDLGKKYALVKLLINKDTYTPEAMKVKMKSGINYTISVQNYEEQKNISDNEFVFDTKAHADVEVVDLRKKK